MSIVMGIDPGNCQSAFVLLDTEKQEILEKEILQNNECLALFDDDFSKPDVAVIEQVAGMGMIVGETVFETAVWSGRFMQHLLELGYRVERIKRNTIKNILCGTSRAKDKNIRQRLIDIYGEQGTKKNQGKTYGMKADMWAALAVATAWDIQEKEKTKNDKISR
jgi:Holliday junction resolvasome RuvABC endonuclease subunit